HPHPHSFPTRRSSDLEVLAGPANTGTDEVDLARLRRAHRRQHVIPTGLAEVDQFLELATDQRARRQPEQSRGGSVRQVDAPIRRSEEHTSELQSRENL